ncbi:MAG: ornithine cyclodeaminase family protein [Anaerolineales bacterium]|nr:ornithine cyclodeaminase family protein [Anaerolineales bacterium]
MQLRILSSADVRAALPMPRAIEAMRCAFGQLSSGQAVMPLRSRLSTDEGLTLFMPAYLRASGDFAVKVVSVYEGNRERGLPAVLGVVLVLDAHTGAPRALLDGATLTELRTGAGGGLAAELLARKDARIVGMFGASVQARAQLAAVLAVRRITEVRVLSRSESSAARFAAEVSTWPDAPRVTIARSPREVVAGADIVITATSSGTPVFDGRDLAPGAHLTAVGAHTLTARELDEVAVRRASKIVVDSREAAGAEAGDLLLAGATIYAELGEIVNGLRPGREMADEITLFKSVGIAAQDAAAAGAALAEAEARGLGTVVEI